MANVLDELLDRGYIKQFTHEEETRELLEKEKITFYIGFDPTADSLHVGHFIAMNPCPCGYHGESRCHCTDYEIVKYSQKLSGPIMDRIDIQKHFRSVDIKDLTNDIKGPTSKSLAIKVERARSIQRKRYENIIGISCNAQMTPELIKEYCKLDEYFTIS